MTLEDCLTQLAPPSLVWRDVPPVQPSLGLTKSMSLPAGGTGGTGTHVEPASVVRIMNPSPTAQPRRRICEGDG